MTRETLAIEAGGGGFGPTYRVFRAMEEAGKLRRGYFVEGLGGAQFAYAGVVDRLRRARDDEDRDDAVVLAAADPAQPYGWLLPWPDFGSATESGGPSLARRAAGSRVVLVVGAPTLFLNRAGTRVRIRADVEEDELDRAVRALVAAGTPSGRRELKIETIDGEAALSSPVRPLLEAAGFAPSYKGLRASVDA